MALQFKNKINSSFIHFRNLTVNDVFYLGNRNIEEMSDTNNIFIKIPKNKKNPYGNAICLNNGLFDTIKPNAISPFIIGGNFDFERDIILKLVNVGKMIKLIDFSKNNKEYPFFVTNRDLGDDFFMDLNIKINDEYYYELLNNRFLKVNDILVQPVKIVLEIHN